MSRHEKTLIRVSSTPTPSDIKWSELKRLLEQLGYEFIKCGKTGGSRRKFFNKRVNALFICHEPHPQSIVPKGCIADLVQHLEEHGFL